MCRWVDRATDGAIFLCRREDASKKRRAKPTRNTDGWVFRWQLRKIVLDHTASIGGCLRDYHMLFPYTFDFDLVLLIDYHFGYREKVKKCRKKVTWAFGFTFSEIVSEKVWPIKRKRHNIVLPLLIYHACGITKKILLWNYKKDCGIIKKYSNKKTSALDWENKYLV